MTLPYFNPHKRRFNLAPEKGQSAPNLFSFITVFRTKPDPKAQRSSEEQLTVSIRCLTPGLR